MGIIIIVIIIMLKIPGRRPVKLGSQLSAVSIVSMQPYLVSKQLNNIKRENKWDNRFHLNAIPQYNVPN